MKTVTPRPLKPGSRAWKKAAKEAKLLRAQKREAARLKAAKRKPAVLVPKYSRPEMKRLLEAVLFAADKPVPVSQLCSILSGSPDVAVREALAEMAREYEERGHSFTLKEVGGGFLFSTHPAFEPWVRKLFKGRLTLRLSRSALESVALIAYRQPITKQEIETIRGVNADGVLATLLDRKLVKVLGRKEGSTALLYGTTAEFLQYMGLNNLGDLPQLEEMKAILDAQEAPSEGVGAVGPYAATDAAPTGTEGMPGPAASAPAGDPEADPADTATEETAEDAGAEDTADLKVEDGAPVDEKPKSEDDDADDEDEEDDDEDEDEDEEDDDADEKA